MANIYWKGERRETTHVAGLRLARQVMKARHNRQRVPAINDDDKSDAIFFKLAAND
ncbi:hypothetical protein [Lactiplantibacillus pentosus]|uniref:hypothetical protein n=1 Tax=Lactiplantibacillus pentosus TaxID=1589 RepID=UPI0021821C5D|nr:hypothetical protein [Lactiplantibacillus pentosus]